MVQVCPYSRMEIMYQVSVKKDLLVLNMMETRQYTENDVQHIQPILQISQVFGNPLSPHLNRFINHSV